MSSDTAAARERALLVHINFNVASYEEDQTEFSELVNSAGLESVAVIGGTRVSPDPRYFIGTGKAEELKAIAESSDADVIILNHSLSPGQERNLEKLTQRRVIDRVGLILDIFAQRAHSYEGKLQVELAQLTHLSTRLIRGWTHLERQKGGIGLRGPGETQLETDRRLIRQRIKYINARLDKVKKQRQQGRQRRIRSSIPLITLVGYTNAGKSTLFNHLTGADVYAADQLFATLDPTQRKLEISQSRHTVLSDTVGFIRQIPHDLIDAFHATLLEVREADLLLHVIDVNDEQRRTHIRQVNEVIEEIGAGDVPQLEIYNKIDLHESIEAPKIEYNEDGKAERVWLSAINNAGLDLLKEAINGSVFNENTHHELHLPASYGKLRAHLYDAGVVEQESERKQGGWVLDILMDTGSLEQLCIKSGVSSAELKPEALASDLEQTG